jgi:alcohol dehydrogenase
MRDPEDETARQNMLLGAHLAGAAIEGSMLGAAHACANPLTARLGILHGRAVGVMLPHVIRLNADNGRNPYSHLISDAELLARRVERMLSAAELSCRLRDFGVEQQHLGILAESASKQWTAAFNPRPVTIDDLHQIYQSAW